MSDLTPSGGGRVSRSARERRAYRLILVGGTSAAISVVTFVLALFTSLSFVWFFLTGVIAVICFFLFRRTVSR